LHLIGADGKAAAHTGSACIDWCGHTAGVGYSVAGNMLAGPQVIEATALAYEANAGLPFAERLLAALAAGEAAGGDKRGKQAAALRIHTDEDYPRWTMRVDDHAEPMQELRAPVRQEPGALPALQACLARPHDPAGITDRALIEAEITRFQRERSGAAA
jgi:uncharacterized Ntn-hydrolase superfamily protein